MAELSVNGRTAAGSDCLDLEITIISAEDLRVNGKPIKSNAYVALNTNSGAGNAPLSTTSVDTTGKGYPTWNEKLRVDLPFHSPFLLLEVRRKYSPSSSSRDCLVGSARVPVSDFVGNYTPVNYLHFLSYRLRDTNGARNGIINISARVIRSSSSLSSPLYGPSSLPSSSRPEFGVPVDRKMNGGPVVTGVPFWFPNSSRARSSE